MKIWVIGAVLVFSLLVTAFQQNDTNQGLRGAWVFQNNEGRYGDQITSYIRSEGLVKSKPGLIFRRGGVLVVRQNGSWCATSPITYTNYRGKWSRLGDSVLTLRYPYWGGKIKEELYLLSVDGDLLRTKTRSFKRIPKRR